MVNNILLYHTALIFRVEEDRGIDFLQNVGIWLPFIFVTELFANE